MAAAVHKFRGHDYMPINLKGILIRHDISQTALAGAIRQRNGVPISRTAASFIVNFALFPKATPEIDIKDQVAAFLRERGVGEEEIATMWQPGDDPLRHVQPPGALLAMSTTAARKRAARLELIKETTIDPVENAMLSPAAKKHFKLFRDPFQEDINGPDDVFISTEQRYITEAMYQTAKNGGFLAVPGESGSGKSTLRKLLLERIKNQPIRVIFPRVLDKTRMTTGNICQAIINDLAPGTTVRSSLEGQARQVENVLMQSARADNSHVLLIEEAHDLSIATLKYLKRFYELEDGFRRLLSIVLVGQPELKDKLDEGKHPEAREVIRRCEIAELMPLGADLEKYLAHKLARQSADAANIFAPDAYEGIRARLTKTKGGQTYSQLYPLVVNNLVTKAMNHAAQIGAPQVTADLMRAV
jgi:type II secretory pathway predicted ATPase ExeA